MTEDQGIRLSQLLPGKLDTLEQAISQKIRIGREHSHSGMAWSFICSSASNHLCKVLDCDAFQLIATGWAKAVELREFAEKAQDQTSIFHLGKHDIKTSVHPVITIGFSTPPHVELRFTLEVTAHFKGATLSVRNGHILAVETGQATASAQLMYGTAKLHRKEESPVLKLPGRYEFKDPGVRIG